MKEFEYKCGRVCLNSWTGNNNIRISISGALNPKQERKIQARNLFPFQALASGGTNLQNVAEAVQWQVKYLLCNLTAKKSLKPCSDEIHKVLQMSGNKFEHLLLQIPLELLDVRDPKIQSGGKDQAKVHFLSQEVARLHHQPAFLRYVPIAMDNLQVTNIGEYVLDLFKCLKMQVHEQIVFLVALSHTTNSTYRQDAIRVLKGKLKEYYSAGKPQPLPSYAAHRLLLMLLNSSDFNDDPLYQRDIAQFIRDSMCKSAQAHPFELDPFFASRFSPFHALSEDITAHAPPSPVVLSQPQTGHLVDLADLLVDCEPSISHNYAALQTLCAEYKDKELGEAKMAKLLVKLANSAATHMEDKVKGGAIVPGALYFQTMKPNVKVNGTAVSNLVPAAEGKGWHVENLAKVLRETFGKINWDKVVDHMDKAKTVQDQKAFQFMLTLYVKCRQGPFPVMKLLGQWRNVDSQVALIEYALGIQDQDLINFEHTPRRQSKIDSVQGIKPAVNPFLPAWCSIDLVERLIELSDSPNYMRVRNMFEFPLKSCPEYLLLTVAQTHPKGGQFLLDELYGILLPLFLAVHINSMVVIERLWGTNPRLVMKAICNLYKYDSNLINLSRVLDITQEIKELLKSILALDCYDFTIPLAILAGKRDFLHLDQWISERINTIGEPFVVALLSYLEENVIKKSKDPVAAADTPDKRLEKSYLSPEKLAVIFESLRKARNLPEWLNQQIGAVHKEAITLFPSLVAPSNESPEVEDEANRWFQRVFMGEISVADLINRMKAYKDSKDPKQGEIYACMIHNLLDEYRFFAKYPEKELKITGQLFGSIIQHRLVDSLLEKISLKYVFEALKRSGKMLRFGVYALEQFTDRLKEWPTSIELILKMNNFKNAYPELYNKIQEIGQSVVKSAVTPPPTTQQGVIVEPTQSSPTIPTMESPVVSPIPTPPFVRAPAPQPPIAKPQVTFTSVSQQSPPPPPGYPPGPYMSSYPYQQPPVVPPGVPPPPGAPGYPWRHKPPAVSQPPFPPISKASSVPPKHDYFLGPGGPMLPPARPSDYQNFMRAVENKDFTSEYQGHPQNPPMSHLPTLVESERVRETSHRPAEDVPRPVQSIVENLTLNMNMTSEAEYMKFKDVAVKCIEKDPNTIPWLAHTLVMRAATQQNNHQMFIKFLNAIQNRNLSAMVLNNTCNEIKSILEANKGNENPDDKTKKAIKNLGIFLGLITIADNKPILSKDLDLKEILREGYANNGIALPLILTCQILRQAQNSRVFKPNNPWMRAIFSLLVDLFQIPSVSTNFGLRSEITLLYETLKIPQDYYQPAKEILPKASAPPQLHKPLPVYQGKHPPPIQPSMGPMMPQIRSSYLQPAAVPYRGPSPQPQIAGIIVNHEIAKLLQSIDPNYMDFIKKAIDTSVLDILKPVIERSVTIALITTREIVLKDFALEPSQKKLLEAANQMVQCLAGSLAMVTCREPLRMSMGNRLKDALKQYELPPKDIDQIAKTLCNENLDIGSTYIQKSVIIKARQRVGEDPAIWEALEIRAPEAAPVPLVYNTPKQVPEFLRPKKEGLSTAEIDVYKEFNRVLKENTTSLITDLTEQTEGDVKGKPSGYRIVDSLLAVHKIIENGSYGHPEVLTGMVSRFRQDLQEVERNPKILDQVTREIFQCFVKLARSPDQTFKEKAKIYLKLLCITSGYYKPLPSTITEQLFKHCPEEIKYNYDLVATLFRNSLIDIPAYDIELSEALRSISTMPPGPSDNLLTFVALLVLNLILSEKILQPSQLTNTFMAMNSIHKTSKAQQNAAFVSMLLNLSSNDKTTKSAASQLFEEWVTLNQDQSQEQLHDYFMRLTAHLSSDDRFVGFFTAALETAVQQALFSVVPAPNGGSALVPNYPNRLDFRLIDSVLKLLFTLLPYKLPMCTKYFSNFMRALTNSMKTEHLSKPLQFNQRPYYRFFVIILQSLKKPEVKMLPHGDMLQYIALALHEIAPRYCPGFAFAWLDLVAHRDFMLHLLGTKHEEKHLHGKLVTLLCDMFEFLKIVLPMNEQPTPNVYLYFEAVLRITLVLLHDFPDFLAVHYFELLAALPDHCTQLRNIILSAIPKNVKAPEPKPGIKVDKIPEQKTPPVLQADYKQVLGYRGIREDIDKYMLTANQSLLVDVCNKLMSPESPKRHKRPDLEIFHALVLYLAKLGIAYEPPKKELGIAPILLNILSKLDLPAREQLVNAMFNEIRYPNSYTHYFTHFLLYLMENATIPLIQEQIFRVLLERETSHPPVPWGITIMFMELRQNPAYDLLNKPFVKGLREVEAIILGRQALEQSKED